MNKKENHWKHRGDKDGWDDRNGREVVYQGRQSGDRVSDDRRDDRASGSRQEVFQLQEMSELIRRIENNVVLWKFWLPN